jgi:hypothetical protein
MALYYLPLFYYYPSVLTLNFIYQATYYATGGIRAG